jgi:hydroxyacylglutathione hydrolase
MGARGTAAQRSHSPGCRLIFRQLTHDDLGCASYLIGDEKAAVAAVVDPRLDVDEYLRLARYMGVRIEHILETHNHADHVSGHGRLASATGATIHIHRAADVQYEHEPFEDGYELALGSVTVRALHTPGHRPEHTAFALIDTARGPEPWAVLSGDTLFVGDIARPDLAVDEQEGARGIFHALNDKLLALPDECELWPGHLGGSLCGGPGMDMKVSSTIAYERAHNKLLAVDNEDAFVKQATSSLGPQPPNFQAIVALNRGPLRAHRVDVEPLTPCQVHAQLQSGALLVDVRTDLQFDEAHIPGAVCNPAVRAGFGTKLAWVADREAPVVFIGRDDTDAVHASQLSASVGITNVVGYLAGGMTSWREEKRETASVERIDVPTLHDRIDDVQLLDVRERSEWEEGHIPGAVHTPYHDIDCVPDGIDPVAPVAVICSSGQRSALAGSLLLRHGAERVIHVADGGVGTWAEHGWPTEQQVKPTKPGLR